jgi:hypothetical protein
MTRGEILVQLFQLLFDRDVVLFAHKALRLRGRALKDKT